MLTANGWRGASAWLASIALSTRAECDIRLGLSQVDEPCRRGPCLLLLSMNTKCEA